jgi:2-polyprenyl-3-methyl-5-hydroxy-6-metoxy-1,4-benzoquinol methylase
VKSKERKYNIITGEKTLEKLFCIKKFPVYMGCISTTVNPKRDIKTDMIFDICKKTGIIQLKKTLPLDITNQFPHNDSVGSLWNSHTAEFAKFILNFNPKNVIEIGGGSGKLANTLLKNNNCNWSIIDKQYSGIKNSKITIINKWFNKNLSLKSYDAVIHSHLLEHITEPVTFLKDLSKNISKDTYHIFSVPNLHEWLKSKYTNSLNFEHTLFLTEYVIDKILAYSGFTVIKKHYFDKHSIFYACRKGNKKQLKLKNNYISYKKLFISYINEIQDTVTALNKQIDLFEGTVCLFGAHIFSQMLLAFGLYEHKITYLLDNSELKYGKRLYGTNLIVQKPNVLKKNKNVMVIVKAGIYTNEIKNDILKNINSEVIFV